MKRFAESLLREHRASEPLVKTPAPVAAARQHDQALDQAQKIFDLEPNFPLGRWMFSQAYIGKGMYAEAIALSEKSLQTDPTNQIFLRFGAYDYAKSGRRHEAEELINRFRDIAKTRYVMSTELPIFMPRLVTRITPSLNLKKPLWTTTGNYIA